MSFYLDNIEFEDFYNSYVLINDNKGYCYDENKVFIQKSNDSCFLFNGSCNPPKITNEDEIINFKIIPFITNFHTGVHAYSGIYSMLREYVKNKKYYEDYYIVIYERVQKGILDVIYHFINKSKIILIKENTVYKFSKIRLIPNSLHSFLENHIMSINISDMIISKIDGDQLVYPSKIAILKTFENSITSTMGAIDFNLAKNYCDMNDYVLINPNEMDEITLIRYVNNCEEILLSWGSTFMKNFIYLSEKCLNASVFIFGGSFIYEYNNAIERNIIVNKYKNCNFTYFVEPILQK